MTLSEQLREIESDPNEKHACYVHVPHLLAKMRQMVEALKANRRCHDSTGCIVCSAKYHAALSPMGTPGGEGLEESDSP